MSLNIKKQYHSAFIKRVHSPKWARVGDGIFRIDCPSDVRRIEERLQRDSRPVRHAENENNHEHFTLQLSGHKRLNWQLNYLLAEGVRSLWLAELRLQYPEMEFVSAVINEAYAAPGKYNRHVVPTLRLWTVDSRTDDALIETYHLCKQSRDTVLILDKSITRRLRKSDFE